MEPDKAIELSDVDIHNPELLPHMRVGFALAKDKYERYISKGKVKEAQGCKSAILIFYQASIGINDIDTGWGEL